MYSDENNSNLFVGNNNGKKFVYKELITKGDSSILKVTLNIDGAYSVKLESTIDKNGLIKTLKIWDISKSRVTYIQNEDGDIIFSVNSLTGNLLQEIPLDDGAVKKYLVPSLLCEWQVILDHFFKSEKVSKASFNVSVPFCENSPLSGSLFLKDLPEETSFSEVKVKIKKEQVKTGFLFKIKPFNIEIKTDKLFNILSFKRGKIQMGKQ